MNGSGSGQLMRLSAIPTPEESAKALSDYMAKAHETKLKAIQDVESKKETEIKALKSEIAALKQAPPTSTAIVSSTAATGGDETIESLQAKLVSYQQFIAKYIVEAQQEKMTAVQAAENSMAKKYGLVLSAAPPAATATDAPAITTKETKIYQERNQNVKAAEAAGKSRWSQAELQRASNGIGSVPPPSVTPPAAPAVIAAATATTEVVPPEVEAADHGLRADGGVGGMTLAERVLNGAGGGAIAAPSGVSKTHIIYQQRNARVSAAAKAGKSRWGHMENEKATKLAEQGIPTIAAAAPAVPVTAEIEAADHGLRADGGVSGPTLAERVNLGAMLVA